MPLARLLLTTEVACTLFDEYAAHRATDRGREETGWLLLGRRRGDEALALATIPAGELRDAGVGHVGFNGEAQALASRIVRQADRGASVLGVVHTHPASLRHPSRGDYDGDIAWVKGLRGAEGAFGIGTADAASAGDAGPQNEAGTVWCRGALRFSWYALAAGDKNYRPLPVEVVPGPDLASALRSVWAELETHAGRLDRLATQLAGVTFGVSDGLAKPCLTATVPAAGTADRVAVALEGAAARYYLLRADDVSAAGVDEPRPDAGVYRVLAELAARG